MIPAIVRFLLRCCGAWQPEVGREYQFVLGKDNVRITEPDGKVIKYWITATENVAAH